MSKGFIAGCLLLFASCEEVVFDRIPGTEMKKIPESFRGEYIYYSVSADEEAKSDTGRVKITGKYWIETKDGKTEKSTLINSISRFSKFENYYFISTREAKGWNCIVLEPDGSDIFASPVIAEKDTLPYLIRQYFSSVEEKNDDEGNPYLLVKMNETELIGFYREYLKPLYFVRLEKL